MSGVFGRLLGGRRKPIRRIVFESEVLDELLGAAKSSFPREFGALLTGSLEDDVLQIEGYILPQTLSGRDNVLVKIGMLPPTVETIGSIHSHPGPSALPSTADLHFFQRRGLVHFIMAWPFVRFKVRGYDSLGRPIKFSIG